MGCTLSAMDDDELQHEMAEQQQQLQLQHLTVVARSEPLPPLPPPARVAAGAQARRNESVSQSAGARSVPSLQWGPDGPRHQRTRSDGRPLDPLPPRASAASCTAASSSLASQTRSMRSGAVAPSSARQSQARPHQHVKCKTDFSEPADSLSKDPNYGGVDQQVFMAQLLMAQSPSHTPKSVVPMLVRPNSQTKHEALA